MINKKNIIIISLLIVTIILVYLIITKNQELKKIKNDNNMSKIVEKTNDKEMVRTKLNKNENVVIFGDSITEFYPVNDIYDNYQIIGSGKSGYKTTDLLDNMEDLLYKYNPTKVIMLIGTNDILKDTSEEKQKETVDNIKKICNEIKKNRPKAKLYIESLYPIDENGDKNMIGDRTNEAIKNINKDLKEYCSSKKIRYIDMYDELTDEDGNFDDRYTNDGLHPNDLGYAKITKLLLPYIYE